MPNLDLVMENYGLKRGEGFIFEGDAAYAMAGYPHYLSPSINAHEITEPLIDGGFKVLVPIAHPITTIDAYRSSLKISSLLTTSDKAYSKVEGYNMETFEKEPGDIEGPFSVGTLVTESFEDVETVVVWVSSSELLKDESNVLVGGANSDFFLNSLGFMCERDSSISIRSKDLSVQYLQMSSADGRMWAIIFVIAVPVLTVATGIVVWIRRKKH
jgi:ABC-2 type transport system permease protein